MSKELIKELIASSVDGNYYSFANATGQLIEAKMKDQLVETVADIKASLFEKKHKDDDEDYGVGDKMDRQEEGNTAADQNFNNDQQKQALGHVGQITFAESDETGGPTAAKKRVKNSSVDVDLGAAGPDETSSSDEKAKFDSKSEEPGTKIPDSDKKNKGSVKVKAAGKNSSGADVIEDAEDFDRENDDFAMKDDDMFDEDDDDKYDDEDKKDKKDRNVKDVEKDADDEEDEESEDKVDRKEKMKDKMRYSDDEKEKDMEEAEDEEAEDEEEDGEDDEENDKDLDEFREFDAEHRAKLASQQKKKPVRK